MSRANTTDRASAKRRHSRCSALKQLSTICLTTCAADAEPRPKPDISSVEAFERALLNARAGNQAVASAYYDHGRRSRIRTPLSSQGTALHNPCRPISLGHSRKWHARGIVSGFLLFSPGSKSRWARQAQRAGGYAWSQKPGEADFRLGPIASFQPDRRPIRLTPNSRRRIRRSTGPSGASLMP